MQGIVVLRCMQAMTKLYGHNEIQHQDISTHGSLKKHVNIQNKSFQVKCKTLTNM